MNAADFAYALDTYCVFQKNVVNFTNRTASTSTHMDRTCKPVNRIETEFRKATHRERKLHGKNRR